MKLAYLLPILAMSSVTFANEVQFKVVTTDLNKPGVADIKNPKLKYSADKLSTAEEDAGIKVTLNVEKGKPSELQLKCINSHVARFEGNPEFKKRWHTGVKLLKAMGVKEVKVTVREYPSPAGAAAVKAYLEGSETLIVLVNAIQSTGKCSAAYATTFDTKTLTAFEKAQDPKSSVTDGSVKPAHDKTDSTAKTGEKAAPGSNDAR
jgi:hypothetical protein